MRKPIIGITCNTVLVENAIQPGISRTFVNTPYVSSVALAGGIPILLPPVRDKKIISEQVAMVDGLILSGGPDVNPLLYKEDPLKNIGTVNHERDQYEWLLLEAAEQQKKPMLGICRGVQMINVFYGGTLFQDLDYIDGCHIRHMQSVSRFDALWHEVVIKKGSALSKLYGKDSLTVNSYHHQALKKVAPGFSIAACANDNVIEAIERQGDHFVLGVQWHPELLTEEHSDMLLLFESLISHA